MKKRKTLLERYAEATSKELLYKEKLHQVRRVVGFWIDGNISTDKMILKILDITNLKYLEK